MHRLHISLVKALGVLVNFFVSKETLEHEFMSNNHNGCKPPHFKYNFAAKMKRRLMATIGERWKRIKVPVLWLFAGIYLAVGIQSVNESSFESDILKNIAQQIQQRTQGRSEEVVVDTAVHMVHYLLERRSQILGGGQYNSFKAVNFHSSLQSFYIGTGACGYFSMFAARVFTELGLPVKIVQQRSKGQYGAHITLIVGLEGGKRWVLVDPLYNHVFKTPKGSLAGLEEVTQHWNQYQGQMPKNYNWDYNYQEGYRFTNWDKLGVVSRAAYRVGAVLLGERVMKQVCVRMWVIDPYKTQGILAFLGLGLCLFGLAYECRWFQKK